MEMSSCVTHWYGTAYPIIVRVRCLLRTKLDQYYKIYFPGKVRRRIIAVLQNTFSHQRHRLDSTTRRAIMVLRQLVTTRFFTRLMCETTAHSRSALRNDRKRSHTSQTTQSKPKKHSTRRNQGHVPGRWKITVHKAEVMPPRKGLQSSQRHPSWQAVIIIVVTLTYVAHSNRVLAKPWDATRLSFASYNLLFISKLKDYGL